MAVRAYILLSVLSKKWGLIWLFRLWSSASARSSSALLRAISAAYHLALNLTVRAQPSAKVRLMTLRKKKKNLKPGE